jgi:hypothetical protein
MYDSKRVAKRPVDTAIRDQGIKAAPPVGCMRRVSSGDEVGVGDGEGCGARSTSSSEPPRPQHNAW